MSGIDTNLRIFQIQGSGRVSPFEGETVTTSGQVTGHRHDGFFIQDLEGDNDENTSDGIFVACSRKRPRIGTNVRVTGRVEEYTKSDRETDEPMTRLKAFSIVGLGKSAKRIEPEKIDENTIPQDPKLASKFFEAHEGMLMELPAGAVLSAPSNPFGDYVAFLPREDDCLTHYGTLRIDPDSPEKRLWNFRISKDLGPRPAVNVGATLKQPVSGPLFYRVGGWQIEAQNIPGIDNKKIAYRATSLLPTDTHMTVMTLNTFNLDPKHERRSLVETSFDIDDDVGAGRFASLAHEIVDLCHCSDIIPLQEIQDNNGAEKGGGTAADLTGKMLCDEVKKLSGKTYQYVDVPPKANADGGQPNANIRNGFMFNPERVTLVGDVERIGEDEPCFVDSRKPLVGTFRFNATGEEIVIINVHQASKRHTIPWNANDGVEVDPREDMRVGQAQFIRDYVEQLKGQGTRFYVTGDFNDFEFSKSVQTLSQNGNANLVETVPEEDRFDYVFRGMSQVLSHGIVDEKEVLNRTVLYEILPENALFGQRPGVFNDRPTDHGIAVAQFDMTNKAKGETG